VAAWFIAHTFFILVPAMNWLAEHQTSSLSRAAATAILAALFCPLDLDGYASAFAEVVCWSLVPVFFMLYSRSHIVSWTRRAVKVDAATKYLHWTQAALTAVAALLSSFANSTWIMVGSGYILCSETI